MTFRDDIKVGRVYLAPYDDCHFRARVDRRGISDENSVYVFFIDFGNFETVPISSLIIINENMFEQVRYYSESRWLQL